MKNDDISSAIQAIIGGYMPLSDMMRIAKPFRDQNILPKRAKEWDRLSPKMRTALVEMKQRHDAVLVYRRLQKSMPKKEAAQIIGYDRETLRRWDERLQKGGQMALLARSRARKTFGRTRCRR